MMIGVCWSSWLSRMRRQASKPLMRGMTTSSRMRSGFSTAALRTASSPFDAVIRVYGSLRRMNFSIIRMVLESSTSRIFLRGMQRLLPVLQVRGDVVGGDGCGEEPALAFVAVGGGEELGLVARLHALGHDPQVERVRGGDDGVDDGRGGA